VRLWRNRVGEEKLFREIVGLQEIVRRRWGSESIGREERRRMSAPFGKLNLAEMSLD
jgi:hypothetical protein